MTPSKASGVEPRSTQSTSARPGQGNAQPASLNSTNREAASRLATEPLNGELPSLTDGIKDAANATARAVKEQASAIADEVGHELGKTAEEQIGRGANAIRGFARAVEVAGDELKGQSPELARMIGDAAGKIRDVSEGIGNRKVNELMGVAQDFARNQPAIFFGTAVATGFALARFLKSSAPNGRPATGSRVRDARPASAGSATRDFRNGQPSTTARG